MASAAERRYDHIYSRAKEVHDVLKSTPISGADLNGVASFLLEKYFCMVAPFFALRIPDTCTDTFRRKTFSLISKAFISIPVPVVQQYLGCSVEDVLQSMSCRCRACRHLSRIDPVSAAQEHHWSLDASKNILSPVLTSADPSATTDAAGSTFHMILLCHSLTFYRLAQSTIATLKQIADMDLE